MTLSLNRRSMIAGSLALTASAACSPHVAMARVPGDRNVLFVLLRGAMDGMAMVAPVGDPGFEAARAQAVADYDGAQRLGAMFALHPSLSEVGKAYSDGDALFVHATATSYRDRSHFDGQDLLESGANRPNTKRDGWLNRLVGLLDGAQQPARALAIAPTIPLALRGAAAASNYAPSNLPNASADFLDRVSRLYEGDAQLGALWASALETRAMAADSGLKNLRDAKKTGELIASLMREDAGARIAMIEMNGWDTHANQRGAFARSASSLDALLGAYRIAMGPAWDKTLVLVATEFGRTVRYNGTRGTDHGTASATLVMGGAVRGGQVMGDWPGMGANALFQGRDLKPTTALESVLAGACAQHLGLDPARAMTQLFPDRSAGPLEGLVRT